MVEVKPLTPDLMPDAEALFDSSPETSGCSCMWSIIPYVQYRANGPIGNRQLLHDLVAANDAPVGLLAYRAGEAVGWCDAGPRARFARAMGVPSFKGRDPSEDDSVWLVPCFYVRKDARREGVSRALLDGAVALAQEHGATAIEGFPFAHGAKLGRESMVGVEALFAACGFAITRRPSATRVVMRREFRPRQSGSVWLEQTGWAGSVLARHFAGVEDSELSAAVSRRHAGRNLGEVLAEPYVDGALPAIRKVGSFVGPRRASTRFSTWSNSGDTCFTLMAIRSLVLSSANDMRQRS